MRDVAGDVDVRASDVEGVPVDRVTVGIGDVGLGLRVKIGNSVIPTRIDGVSSGGVTAAAGVTCAPAPLPYRNINVNATILATPNFAEKRITPPLIATSSLLGSQWY